MTQWRHHVDLYDVFHNNDMDFIQRRDVMVIRIKEGEYYSSDDSDLVDIVDHLGSSSDPDHWNIYWNDFYDWADDNLVWVNIHFPPKETCQL